MVLSSKEYGEKEGKNCPVCGSHRLSRRLFANVCTSTVCECQECGSKWDEVVVAVGYKNLNQGTLAREKEADRLFDAQDFFPYTVKDSDGWEVDEPNGLLRKVEFENPNDPVGDSLLGFYRVLFGHDGTLRGVYWGLY